LSLSVGVVSSKDSNASRGELLVDDTEICWKSLSSLQEKNRTIIIVLDNCGIELLSDLKLASFLLTCGYSVELHCKAYPVFVSDAILMDVVQHMDWLRSQGLCLNLSYLISNFTCKAYEFYCSPKFFDEHDAVPRDLVESWSSALLVIVKGDANYRRLVRDCYRPDVTIPFAEVIGMKSANILAIRTLQSPVAVGLVQDVVNQVQARNANWCGDGSCGVIQYYGGRRSSSSG
jgi:hypothetical protein